MVAISPEECIDCGLCVPECPVDAIYPDDEVPANEIAFIELNDIASQEWPNIVETKEALAETSPYDPEQAIKIIQTELGQ